MDFLDNLGTLWQEDTLVAFEDHRQRSLFWESLSALIFDQSHYFLLVTTNEDHRLILENEIKTVALSSKNNMRIVTFCELDAFISQTCENPFSKCSGIVLDDVARWYDAEIAAYWHLLKSEIEILCAFLPLCAICYAGEAPADAIATKLRCTAVLEGKHKEKIWRNSLFYERREEVLKKKIGEIFAERNTLVDLPWHYLAEQYAEATHILGGKACMTAFDGDMCDLRHDKSFALFCNLAQLSQIGMHDFSVAFSAHRQQKVKAEALADNETLEGVFVVSELELLLCVVANMGKKLSRVSEKMPVAWLYFVLLRAARLEKLNADYVEALKSVGAFANFSPESIDGALMDLMETHCLTYHCCEEGITYRRTQKSNSIFAKYGEFSMLSLRFDDNWESLLTMANGTKLGYRDAEMCRSFYDRAFMLERAVFIHNDAEFIPHRSHIIPSRPIIAPNHLCDHPALLYEEECLRILQFSRHPTFPENLSVEAESAELVIDLCEKLRALMGDARHAFEYVQNAVQWWTFAGTKINRTLTLFLNACFPSCNAIPGNLCVRIKNLSGLKEKPENLAFFFTANEADVVSKSAEVLRDHASTGRFAPFEQGMQGERLKASRFDSIFDVEQTFRFLRELRADMPHVTHHPYFLTLTDTPIALKKSSLVDDQSRVSQMHLAAVSFSKKPGFSEVLPPVKVSAVSTEMPVLKTTLPILWIDDERRLNLLVDLLLKKKYISLDVETTIYNQSLCLIQISDGERNYLIDALAIDIGILAQVFENPALIKIIHNATFEKSILAKHGIYISNIADTLAISRKKYGKIEGGHSLKAVCVRELQKDLDKSCQTSRWNIRPLSKEQIEYAALDAEILIHLYRKFMRLS